ncbi:MAG: alpha-L-rhamnosidase N-terminal domain-containing protein, partial [Armatimonadetes bacterium]|nr:alpha-L-rhamnosidase N-terminal domain-containing protein [Armatimonadota bacterium]
MVGVLVALMSALAPSPSDDPTIGPINLTGRPALVTDAGVQAPAGTTRRCQPDTDSRRGVWIWTPESDKAAPARFRRHFTVNGKPRSARLYASAEASYRLWINGRLVARGPADAGRDYDSSAPGPWFDDLRDVTRFMRQGDNVVAVEVFPRALVSNEGVSDRPGLKVDLHVASSQGKFSIATDASWKSAAAEDLRGHEGPNGFRVDLTREPVGWQSVGFDDSHWNRSVTSKDQRTPNILSDLAAPLEAVVQPVGLARLTDGVTAGAGQGAARLTKDGAYCVRFPRVLSARLAMRVQGHAGARLLIMPNEADAPGYNRRAEILLRDGEQVVELPYLDSFTTVNVEAKGVKRPIEINEVRAIFTSYPVRYQGSFACDNPELNRIWQVGRWVTQICMQTHHLDSPHHQEPISDAGDYLIEALNNYYSFGEPALARQDLRKIARTLEQRHMQSFHTSYSLLWLRMLLQHADYTGEVGLLKELAPTAHRLIDRFTSYIGKNGLISEAPNYMFMDWVEIAGFNAHHPPAVIGQGYMTALYYQALDDDRRLALMQGDTARAKHDEELRSRVKQAFDRELWSEAQRLYRDGRPNATSVAPNQWLPADKDVETFSTQVNTLAVCVGLAGPDRAHEVMGKVLARPDMNCQPYFMHFVFEALAKSGHYSQNVLPQI